MTLDRTITTLFMVPTLHTNTKHWRETLLGNNFINGYSHDALREKQYEGCVFLLFKPKDIDKFREFLDGEYERTKTIIEDYDYENNFVVIVYKLNKKFDKDFSLIRKGKYSKTSQEFQNLFPQKTTLRKGGMDVEEPSLQYRIFKRTEDLIKYWEVKFDVTFGQEQEVWHGWDDKKETLTKNVLLVYEQQNPK